MKKIVILIFGTLIALPAICQTVLNDLVSFPDTTNMSKGFVMIYPKPFLPQGEIRNDLFRVKWQKVVDLKLNTGGLINYQPKSDQGNSPNPKTMIRVLASHIPMNADIKPEEITLVQNLINEIVKTGVYIPPITSEPKPDIIEDIDDAVQAVNVYTPPTNLGVNVANPNGWNHYANNTTWNTNHHKNTASFANVVGSTLEVSFTGYRIEWFTEKRINHGIAAVKIDNGPELDIDLYEARQDNIPVKVFTWISPDGTNGPHKITIRATGRKNPSATESNIIHDYFKVYRKQ